MTAPQPSLKAFAITLRFVPGWAGADDEGIGEAQTVNSRGKCRHMDRSGVEL
jgi:hypothetical protein